MNGRHLHPPQGPGPVRSPSPTMAPTCGPSRLHSMPCRQSTPSKPGQISPSPPTGDLTKAPVKVSATGGGGGTSYSGDTLVVYGDHNPARGHTGAAASQHSRRSSTHTRYWRCRDGDLHRQQLDARHTQSVQPQNGDTRIVGTGGNTGRITLHATRSSQLILENAGRKITLQGKTSTGPFEPTHIGRLRDCFKHRHRNRTDRS